MMSEAIKGKNVAEIADLSVRFRAFLRDRAGEGAGEDSTLGELNALGVVRQYPVRIKCALLPWTALEEAIKRR